MFQKWKTASSSATVPAAFEVWPFMSWSYKSYQGFFSFIFFDFPPWDKKVIVPLIRNIRCFRIANTKTNTLERFQTRVSSCQQIMNFLSSHELQVWPCNRFTILNCWQDFPDFILIVVIIFPSLNLCEIVNVWIFLIPLYIDLNAFAMSISYECWLCSANQQHVINSIALT